MDMLRVAMRRTGSRNEWGRRRLLCAAAVAVTFVAGAVVARGEGTKGNARQNGSAGGSGHATAHGASSHAPGYLGIIFHDLSEEQVAEQHLKSGHGVEIFMVDHDGPAGKAGLKPHDVIVSMNGQVVASAQALGKMIHDAGVGADVQLTVMRGDGQVTVTTQLADRDDVEREARKRMETAPAAGGDPVVGGSGFVEGYATESAAAPAPAADPHDARGPGFIGTMLHSAPYTGLAMAAMEPQLAAYFGAPAGTGMLVQMVAANSPAAAAGLRAGDVVLKADAVAIHSSADWTKRLHASKGGPMALTVLRDKREMMVTLAPGLKKHSMLEWPRLF
jgi:serine protease Do